MMLSPGFVGIHTVCTYYIIIYNLIFIIDNYLILHMYICLCIYIFMDIQLYSSYTYIYM